MRHDVLLLLLHVVERAIEQVLHRQVVGQQRQEEPQFAHLAVAKRGDDVVLQQRERVRRDSRENVIPEHGGRDEVRALFSQTRRQRLSRRVEGAAGVGVGALKEDRHKRRRTAAQRVTHDHQLRGRRDLGYSSACRPTLPSSASSTKKSAFSTGFFSKSSGNSCRRVKSLITSLATRYMPFASPHAPVTTRWVYSPLPSNPNSFPASSSDWVSTTQIVGIPPTSQNIGHDVLHGPGAADADHDAVVLGVVRDEPRRAAHATRHSSGHSSHVGVRAVDEGSPKISKDRLECYLSLFAHTKPTFSWL